MLLYQDTKTIKSIYVVKDQISLTVTTSFRPLLKFNFLVIKPLKTKPEDQMAFVLTIGYIFLANMYISSLTVILLKKKNICVITIYTRTYQLWVHSACEYSTSL